MKEDKKKLGQLIVDVTASQKELGMRHTVRLLDALILELREENDTVEGTPLYRNQGEIRGYKRLKEYILRGLPTGSLAESS